MRAPTIDRVDRSLHALFAGLVLGCGPRVDEPDGGGTGGGSTGTTGTTPTSAIEDWLVRAVHVAEIEDLFEAAQQS